MMLKQIVTRAAAAPLDADVRADFGDQPVSPPNAGTIGRKMSRDRSSPS